jgi:hypothetical protein
MTVRTTAALHNIPDLSNGPVAQNGQLARNSLGTRSRATRWALGRPGDLAVYSLAPSRSGVTDYLPSLEFLSQREHQGLSPLAGIMDPLTPRCRTDDAAVIAGNPLAPLPSGFRVALELVR